MYRFNRALSQKLKRRLGRAEWIGVPEFHPKRSVAEGRPVPHAHYVIVNKEAGGFNKPWIISNQEFEEMWNRAIQLTVGEDVDIGRSRVGVEMVMHSVVGYLSKYLSKGSDIGEMDWASYQGLIPKQWVYVSGDLRSREKSLRVGLSGDQVAWAITNADWLKRNRICHSRVFAPDDMPVGNICSIQFYSVTGLSHFLALYERDVRRQLDSHLTESYCQLSKYEFDPTFAVGLPVPPVELEAYDLATIPVRDSGRVPDEFREVVERIFRKVDVPEPVFLGAGPLPVKGTRQMELFASWLDSVEIQDEPGSD